MSNELTHNPGQFDEVIHIIDNARSRAKKAAKKVAKKAASKAKDAE